MMGLVPVLGKLRNNLIAVNRRSIADNVIKASNNLNSGHQEHKPWLHPDPCIRSLLRKFSLPTCKELWTDWTPNKQFTYGQLWTQLLSPLVTFDPPESTHRRLMDDDPQITAAAAFAVAEFNKQKNAQLRFIRAVKGFRSCFYYFLTMEAVDAHAVRTYQAVVKEKRMHPYEPFKVLLFGLVADNGNGNLLNLIDSRRNGPYGECLYDDRGFTTTVGDYKLEAPMKAKRCSLEGEILSSLHMLQVQKGSGCELLVHSPCTCLSFYARCCRRS